jgi:hypothetical protein
VQEWAACRPDGGAVAGDDQPALLFACCHPALDPASRVTLTLRVVCGLPTASIARLLLPEPAVAQRIVRAKRKIRDAGIRLRVPDPGERPARLAPVLRAIYLTFTEGHSPHGTSAVVRDDLCEEALRLARRLHRLLPDEPEAAGLLALILLTSARAAAPTGTARWSCSLTRTAAGGTGAAWMRDGRWPKRRWPSAVPARTSCRPPSPPATPTRRHPPTLTGGRSPRCTVSCSGSTRHRSSRQTAPSPSRTPRRRRRDWQSWTRSRPAPGSPAGRSCTSPAPRCSPGAAAARMPSPHTATLSRSSRPARSAGTSPARSPRSARHRPRPRRPDRRRRRPAVPDPQYRDHLRQAPRPLVRGHRRVGPDQAQPGRGDAQG